MAYQKNFWKGDVRRTNRDDKIRPNPEAPPMHAGPGEQDTDMPSGADAPELGSSQPRAKGGARDDSIPLPSQKKKGMRGVMRAMSLRMADDGTTMGTAIGGGAAGGGAG